MNDVTVTTGDLPTAKVEQRIAEYVAVRDRIKAIKDEQEKALEPLVELQNMLTGWLQSVLDKTGAESIKTAAGTAYTTTRYTASLSDPKAFMDFVITTKNFDLLDRKANVTAVKDYLSENKMFPPGVNLSSIATIGVRRASGK